MRLRQTGDKRAKVYSLRLYPQEIATIKALSQRLQIPQAEVIRGAVDGFARKHKVKVEG